jgi:predicted DCC family thiol-disulfide oxidoreductase YuxK
VNTEITEYNKEGWVLYDGDCPLCSRTVRRFGQLLRARGLQPEPLQSPWVARQLGLSPEQLLVEMRLLLPDGRLYSGGDAILQIARRYWWAWPLYLLGHVPGVKPLLRVLYRLIARNRYCISNVCGLKPLATGQGACTMPAKSKPCRFIPLLLLPFIALCLINDLAPWVFMWALAFALYAGCKWLTYCDAISTGVPTTPIRASAYLFAWPGMDATTFLRASDPPTRPPLTECLFAILKTVFGAVMVWVFARRALEINPLLAGWTGMVGIIFLLHFGTFHLLSVLWRWFGINAPPIMRNPIFSTSLAEFWGNRWNTAFHELASRYTFRPLRRATNPAVATLLVFVLSGLIHDLVISVPARGGYALPTAYFLLQGLGTVGERSRLGRRLGLGRGFRGRTFAVLITAGPVFWLFHPPFIHNVILPMLQAIGAT